MGLYIDHSYIMLLLTPYTPDTVYSFEQPQLCRPHGRLASRAPSQHAERAQPSDAALRVVDRDHSVNFPRHAAESFQQAA